jgi:hypothetical protein
VLAWTKWDLVSIWPQRRKEKWRLAKRRCLLEAVEKSMLKSLKLRGVDHVKKVFMRG